MNIQVKEVFNPEGHEMRSKIRLRDGMVEGKVILVEPTMYNRGPKKSLEELGFVPCEALDITWPYDLVHEPTYLPKDN